MAQLGGENLRGDYGMKSGSQGPPGFYLGDIFYFYRTDTIKDLNGDDLSHSPAIDIFGNIILLVFLTLQAMANSPPWHSRRHRKRAPGLLPKALGLCTRPGSLMTKD
jgi:hypothetical protein